MYSTSANNLDRLQEIKDEADGVHKDITQLEKHIGDIESKCAQVEALLGQQIDQQTRILHRQMLYIYIYYDHPLSTAIATAQPQPIFSSITLDGATILSWAHDPDCQQTIACDTIQRGSLNH